MRLSPCSHPPPVSLHPAGEISGVCLDPAGDAGMDAGQAAAQRCAPPRAGLNAKCAAVPAAAASHPLASPHLPSHPHPHPLPRHPLASLPIPSRAACRRNQLLAVFEEGAAMRQGDDVEGEEDYEDPEEMCAMPPACLPCLLPCCAGVAPALGVHCAPVAA